MDAANFSSAFIFFAFSFSDFLFFKLEGVRLYS